MQGRNQNGQFAFKSSDRREVRSIRLTDSAWQFLGELAEGQEITRADLLEELVAIMGNQFLSGRIPPDLYEAVNQRMEVTGKTRTEIMIEALCAYLKCPMPENPKNGLEKRVEELEQKIGQLEKKIEPVSEPQEKSTPPLSEFFSTQYDKHYTSKRKTR